jgi:hypothetical protein
MVPSSSSTLLYVHPTSTTIFLILSKQSVLVLSFEYLTDNSISWRKEFLLLVFNSYKKNNGNLLAPTPQMRSYSFNPGSSNEASNDHLFTSGPIRTVHPNSKRLIPLGAIIQTKGTATTTASTTHHHSTIRDATPATTQTISVVSV